MDLFCDGGCVGANPSLIGATWAWVQVEAGREVRRDSGVITVAEIGLPWAENNFAELLAAVLALEQAPEGFSGVLHSDNQNAVRRLTRRAAGERQTPLNGIPDWLRARRLLAMSRAGVYSLLLMGGHPTRADLARGFRPDGKPVSRWNVLCDELCREAALALANGG